MSLVWTVNFLKRTDSDLHRHEPAAETAPIRNSESVSQEPPQASQPAQLPALQVQTQASEPAPAITSPPTQTPLGGAPGLFQQSIPQQAHHQQISAPAPIPPVSQPQHQSGLSSSLSQPALPAQVSVQPQSSASTSNISSYAHQGTAAPPSLPSHQLPQQQSQSQGLLTQQHQQYVQHGIPTHLDQQPTQPPQVAPATQQNAGGHSSYFRQQEAPYFHTPTPPVSASQTQDGPYGSFGQLSGQLGHQNQASHLGGFGGADYQYGGESQRVR